MTTICYKLTSTEIQTHDYLYSKTSSSVVLNLVDTKYYSDLDKTSANPTLLAGHLGPGVQQTHTNPKHFAVFFRIGFQFPESRQHPGSLPRNKTVKSSVNMRGKREGELSNCGTAASPKILLPKFRVISTMIYFL